MLFFPQSCSPLSWGIYGSHSCVSFNFQIQFIHSSFILDSQESQVMSVCDQSAFKMLYFYDPEWKMFKCCLIRCSFNDQHSAELWHRICVFSWDQLSPFNNSQISQINSVCVRVCGNLSEFYQVKIDKRLRFGLHIRSTSFNSAALVSLWASQPILLLPQRRKEEKTGK